MMQRLWQELRRRWCRLFHRGARWPIHGEYQCPDCLVHHPVPHAKIEDIKPPRLTCPGRPQLEVLEGGAPLIASAAVQDVQRRRRKVRS